MALIDIIYPAVTVLFVVALILIMLYVNEERASKKARLRERRRGDIKSV